MPALAGMAGANGAGADARIGTAPAGGAGGTGAMASVSGMQTAAGTGAGLAGAMAAAGISGAAAGTGAAGTSGQAASMQCPAETCMALPALPPEAAALGFDIKGCCASTGECGTSMNGGACVATPDSDPQCPAVNAMGFNVPSCCTTTGRCGIDGSAFQMPCMSFEDVAVLAAGFLTVPAPQACTPKS